MAEHRMELCIRGYHIYKDIWLAENDQILSCQREIRNRKDPYAVAVTKDGATVGHLPRKVARMCSLFIRRGGTIKCIVNGRKRYSRDLPQGGLEIPCTAVFTGTREEIERFKRLCRQDRQA